MKKTHVQRWSNKFQSSGCNRYYSANRINCNRFVEFNRDKKEYSTLVSWHAQPYAYLHCRHTHQKPTLQPPPFPPHHLRKINYQSSITFRGHGTFVAGLRRSAMHLSHFEFDICDWPGYVWLVAKYECCTAAPAQLRRTFFGPLYSFERNENGWNLPTCKLLA